MKCNQTINRAAAKEPAGGAGKKADSGEVYAAIAMALYELSEEAHDVESGILTLQDAPKYYHPWCIRYNSFKKDPVRK